MKRGETRERASTMPRGGSAAERDTERTRRELEKREKRVRAGKGGRV